MRSRRLLHCLFICTALLAACGEPAAPPPSPAGPAVAEIPYVLPVAGLGQNEMRLIKAAAAGDLPGVIAALEAGADVNAEDRLKRNAVFAAAFTNRAAVIRELAARGASLNDQDGTGMTPLHVAVAMGAREALAALLDLGADVNRMDVSRRTPLHIAAATNQPALGELLLARGADPRLADKAGKTAATLAREAGHASLANRLHERSQR